MMRATSAAPATIHRALGSTEGLYGLLDRLYCLNFVVFGELQGTLDAGRLQAALATVQDIHPLLRARIVNVGGRSRFEPVQRRLAPLRAEVRGHRGWRREIERQLQTPFDPGQAPLARFLWFNDGGSRSVVAMTFHHPIGDGRSGGAVLLDVLRRATVDRSPPAYRPARASSQSLDVVAHKPRLIGALQGMRFWLERGRDALQFARQLPGYDPTPNPDRDVRIIALGLAPAQLASLQRQCREHGTTVHGALGAAQLLAVNDQFGSQAPRRLALNSLADLRGVLSGALSDADLGLYISTLCTVHALPRRPDFWALAREIRDSLKRQLDSGDANLIHGVYPPNPVADPGEGVARLVHAVVALAPPSTMLTNIGRIQEVDLGPRLALRTLAFAVSPPAQHPVCVTANSYGGRMFVNLLHDQNKLGSEPAKAIGERLMHHLTAASRPAAAPPRTPPST